jgi:ABC-2 type transport system permease protein
MHSGISVIWDKEFGFMKEILVSPASRFEIMAGKVLGGSTIAVVEGMIILLLGPIIGAKLTAAKIVTSITIMFLMSLSLVSIGLIVSAIMRSFEGFQSIMTFIIMPMFFLSGAVFPLDKVPSWMTPLTVLDPLTYGVDALRMTLVGVGYRSILVDVVVMTATAVVTISIGTKAFENTE